MHSEKYQLLVYFNAIIGLNLVDTPNIIVREDSKILG